MLKQLCLAHTDLHVSEMALGVMPWGTLAPLERALALYDVFRAGGGNVLDSAHLYACWEKTPEGLSGLGASERTLGQVLRQRGDRKDVVVITKGGHPTFAPHYMRPDHYLSPEVITRDLKESLERLGVAHIDLYFLHRDDRRVPIGEIVDIMNEHVAQGAIRYFGGSNWSPQRMEEGNRYAAGKGVQGFAASQPEFNLAIPNAGQQTDDLGLRFIMGDDLAWHERTQFPAFCYSPTARGYLASNGKKAAAVYGNAQSHARLERAEALARKKGVSANQVALAFIRAQKFPAIPIPGPSSVEHLRDAMQAMKLRLSADEIGWLTV